MFRGVLNAAWAAAVPLACLIAVPVQGQARSSGPPVRHELEGVPIYRGGTKFRARENAPSRPDPPRATRGRSTSSPASEVRPTAATQETPQEIVVSDASSPAGTYLDEGLPDAAGACPCDDFNACSPESIFDCQQVPWSAGVEFTFLKPHFDSNVAFTTLNGDGATMESFTETNFDYDRELAPRVWIEGLQCSSLGVRAGYWQFDHPARSNLASPPANGFGRLTTPPFGTVDLSTSVPNSTLATASGINAYSIDLETTKSFDAGAWSWLATAGLRYAEVDQQYNAVLRNAAGNIQGTIDYSQMVQGFGPTVSLRTQRPFTPQLALFGFARGAVLAGDGESTLSAVEDQDLDTELITSRTSERDDLLPIGEMQVGLQWTPPCPGIWHPYLHVALEGQVWGGAGNASSSTGNLGFFGFNVALGTDW